MNSTSKLRYAWAFLLLLAGCAQGPWDFWPKDPPVYRGIWVYAHVVENRPLRDVCFEPILPLEGTASKAFAFYNQATVVIEGPFSGMDTAITLTVNAASPNCFDGPDDLLPKRGGTYHLDATINWDSAGSTVNTHMTAVTKIPLQFGIDGVRVRGLAKMESVILIDSIATKLYAALGITADTLIKSPLLLDSLVAANTMAAAAMLGDLYVPIRKTDTIHYMGPPLDLKSHQVIPHYGEDVGGILITQHYPDNVGKPEGTFDNLFGMSPDSSDKAEIGNSHRLSYIGNQFNPSTGSNVMDTLGLLNTYLYVGGNKFYFYGTTKDYADYDAASIEGAGDSRIRPVTNIVNGQGIFAGMAVDSIELEVKAYPNITVWPYERTRILACRKVGWDSRSYCRGEIMDNFCHDSLSTAPDCRTLAIATALDSGLAWNALVDKAYTPVADDSVEIRGELRYCIQNNFPTGTQICDEPRKSSLESKTDNAAMTTLWNWCEDRGWPLDNAPQCGSALVSWYRLNDVISVPYKRETKKWCAAHPDDVQCSY